MCNIAMWHCFVRSLHDSNSVAAATLNSCLNLIFTVTIRRYHDVFFLLIFFFVGGV